MAEDIITSSLDLRRMVQEAQAAGFNPLTVLRNGGAAGFATQRNQYGVTGGGSFTAEAPATAAPQVSMPVGATPVPGGYMDANSYMMVMDNNGRMPGEPGYDPPGQGSHYDAPGEWEQATEFNMAVAQLRMRSDDVVTDDGRVVPTRHSVPQAGGPLNPASYTGAGGERTAVPPVPQSTIERGPGWQKRQVYQTDKLPNIIEESTWHMILPGVSWEELGGVSRGETGETVYGEEGLGSLFGVPKGLNDMGHNMNRLYDHLNGPRLLYDTMEPVHARRPPPFSESAAARIGSGQGGGGW